MATPLVTRARGWWNRLRAWWHTTWEPHDPDTDEPTQGHDHGLPSLKALLVVVALGLTAGVIIVYVGLEKRVSAAEQYQREISDYIAGRGEVRDAETRRLDDRLDDLVCDVLSQLPPSSNLDRLRDRYGCGPGLDPGVIP